MDIKKGRLYVFKHTAKDDPWDGMVVRITKVNTEGGFHDADFGPDTDFKGLVMTSELTPVAAGMRLQ